MNFKLLLLALIFIIGGQQVNAFSVEAGIELLAKAQQIPGKGLCWMRNFANKCGLVASAGGENFSLSFELNKESLLGHMLRLWFEKMKETGLLHKFVCFLKSHIKDGSFHSNTAQAAIKAALEDGSFQIIGFDKSKVAAARWLAIMTIVFIAKLIANDGKEMARIYDEKHPEKYSSRDPLKIFYAHLKMLVHTMAGMDVSGWIKFFAAIIAIA